MMRNSPDILRLLFVGVGIVARIWFPIFLSSVFCDFRLSIRIEERIRSRKGKKTRRKIVYLVSNDCLPRFASFRFIN